MKKIFVAMLALAVAAACSNEEIVSVNREAIAFDNAFINNSVRSVNDPSYTMDGTMFTSFNVFGFVQDATLFDNVPVTYASSKWSYTNTQYWIAGAQYTFHAVAPTTANVTNAAATTTNGVTLSYTNVAGTEDLLYAYATEAGKVSGNQPVKFDFRHILSKVKFSFENAYNASTATIQVTDVKITNAHSTANVALNNTTTTWSGNAGKIAAIEFGDATDPESDNYEKAYACGTTYESANERFVIPTTNNYAFNISFVANLYINGTQVDVDAETAGVNGYAHTATVTFAPQPGNSYDIKAVIDASNIDPNHAQEPIKFTVNSIGGWGTPENKNATINNNTANN